MDSKLRKIAAFSSVAAVVLIVLLVVYANQSSGKRGQGNMAASTAVDSESGSQVAAETDGAATDGRIGDDLSAFLNDPYFFDREENPILQAARESSEMISLVVTSVEKDLRIQVVDADGELVTGESFLVALDGLDEYKDLDKDGVIYIGDLSAGDYEVSLKPISGYRVSEAEIKVHVKDKVEYVAIDDISLLLLTEDDIDAEAEDTEVADALQDADKTEIKKLQTTTANTKVGIDVSKWNGDIDWDKVKNAGVDFAIIRVGYRGSVTGSLVEDPYFETNMKGAMASGLSVGVYFFTQATNEVEAVEEASAVLALIRKYKLEYPVYIDTEGAGGSGRADALDAETRTLVCEAFCRTIENAGYTAGVYASRNWYNNNLYVDRLDDYQIWLAEYRSTPLYQGYYTMWQYTSKGSVDGISGNVDMDISYGVMQ